MKIYHCELTEEDIALIEEALRAWEDAKTKDGLMAEVFGAVLGVKADQSEEETRRGMTQRMDRAQAETSQRQRRTTRLRAKIYEMMDRPGEVASHGK